ncbi:MAG: cation transporting ATPase C-terminal domain-containing protein, partial [Candidatus Kariarchaeaceae archaeon]
DNMTKFIRYMLSSNLAEIVVIFMSIVITKNPALVATQILWINLVTDGVPALALGVDPSSKDIMLRNPRHPKESLLAKDRLFHILFFGGFMSIITLGSFLLFFDSSFFLYEGDVSSTEAKIKASTIAFAVLSISQFAHALNVREETASILGRRFFKNKFLLITVFIALVLQIFVIQGDAILSSILDKDIVVMEELFRTVPLNYLEWLWVAIVSTSLIAYAELLKVIKRNTRFDYIC